MTKVWKIGLVVAALAAVGVAGSAGAAKFITGGDIKNGSIGLKDLSRAARRALLGRTGPAGPAGATGPQGPPGPQGPSSINTTVRTRDFSVTVASRASGEVRCPDGMVATGGSVSTRELYVLDDQPSSDGRGWVGATADFDGVTGGTMRIAVVCTPGSATVLPTGS
jgi:hypothetical protein